jgi:hypothetical protein
LPSPSIATAALEGGRGPHPRNPLRNATNTNGNLRRNNSNEAPTKSIRPSEYCNTGGISGLDKCKSNNSSSSSSSNTMQQRVHVPTATNNFTVPIAGAPIALRKLQPQQSPLSHNGVASTTVASASGGHRFHRDASNTNININVLSNSRPRITGMPAFASKAEAPAPAALAQQVEVQISIQNSGSNNVPTNVAATVNAIGIPFPRCRLILPPEAPPVGPPVVGAKGQEMYAANLQQALVESRACDDRGSLVRHDVLYVVSCLQLILNVAHNILDRIQQQSIFTASIADASNVDVPSSDVKQSSLSASHYSTSTKGHESVIRPSVHSNSNNSNVRLSQEKWTSVESCARDNSGNFVSSVLLCSMFVPLTARISF